MYIKGVLLGGGWVGCGCKRASLLSIARPAVLLQNGGRYKRRENYESLVTENVRWTDDGGLLAMSMCKELKSHGVRVESGREVHVTKMDKVRR